jgi:CDGSH-type Zn-finger protein
VRDSNYANSRAVARRRSHQDTIVMPDPNISQRFPYVQDAEPGTYWWCSCGQSKNQPFCDGSHKTTSFTPLKIEVAAAGKIAWCGCKHSKNGAFCDGSHKRL